MLKQISEDAKRRMDKSMEVLEKELASIRTGRASLSLLDHIRVDYYGTPSPLNQVANLAVPEPNLITVQPWETPMLEKIEKAIRSSDLDLNPANDGKILRIPIPSLTEERRKSLVKQVGKIAEESRTSIRQVRRDVNDRLKKLLKDKEISEDDEKRALKEVQDLTDAHIKKVDDAVKKKEQELMTV
ncbi:MAG TPA: ribosome recycling factor [Vicinamibacteria bacterium]